MTDKEKIELLEKQLAEKENDINELAGFVFKTLNGMGVKSFDDIDRVGTTVLKELPSIIMESTSPFPHHKKRLQDRFAHFQKSQSLLEKYKHLIPNS